MKTNRPFAVFDIDGTIFRSSLVVELMYSLVKTGVFPPKAREELRAAHDAWQRREQPDAYDAYIRSLVVSYRPHLSGRNQSEIRPVAAQVVAKYHAHTYVYTLNLMKDRKQKSYVLLAISGSPSELVGVFAKVYGFDDFVASEYVVDESGA